MTAVVRNEIYVPSHWTDEALIAEGFQSYQPVKRLVMALQLPIDEAPKLIETDGEILTAPAGYWIAYVAGKALKEKLNEYEPHPIDPDSFTGTYRPWDEPDQTLTATQAYLRQLGCHPYYKFASIWAKQLSTEIWIQSVSSDEPVMAPVGEWLCIGAEGEPWRVTDECFKVHYLGDRT